MDPSCLNAIVADQEKGAARVAKSFMLRNQAFARKNFGSQSDNATGIVMYITQEE
jgi:SLT domain-containing protein